MQPISVVVTVLNEEQTILSLLKALSEQTLLPAEVIIADGGSRDNTTLLIQEFAKKYPQLHCQLIVKKGNRSIGRNEAISKARSSWIAITDAGCVPHPDWLEKLSAAAEKISTTDFVVAGYYDAQPQTPFEEAVVPYVLVMSDQLHPNAFLPATRSMLMSKSAWKKVNGFNENLSDNEDYAFAHAIKKAQISLSFTAAAKVTWKPRTTLNQFMWMIFRFARGDAQARIWRPKVLLILGRYFLAALLAVGWVLGQLPISTLVLIYLIGLFFYCCWAIQKNRRYVPHGWFWLPVLQITSDLAVIKGTLVGLLT